MIIKDNILIRAEEEDIVNGVVVVPKGVQSIERWAFEGCTSLTQVTIPEGVQSIERWAFEGCTSLTQVTIPEGVQSIEYGAFYGCTSLTQVTIPEGVQSIERWAFYGCTSLTQVTIPEGVQSIGYGAFEGCTSLTQVTIPEGVQSIGYGAFCGCASLTQIAVHTKDGIKEYDTACIDGILTLIYSKETIKGDLEVCRGAMFEGMDNRELKLKKCAVVTQGDLSAHGETLKKAIQDLRFKQAKDRGAEQYKGLQLCDTMPLDEAKTMYRVITGACEIGTDSFADGLKASGKLKQSYSVQEMLDITKGQHGSEVFENFIVQ